MNDQLMAAAAAAILATPGDYPGQGQEHAWAENFARAALEAVESILPADLTTTRQLIGDLTDDEECWFDGRGGCQAHGYISLKPGEKCPQHEAKEWVAAYDLVVDP